METGQPLRQLGYETSTRFRPFVEWIRALWRSLEPSSQPSGSMDTVPNRAGIADVEYEELPVGEWCTMQRHPGSRRSVTPAF